MRRRALLAGLLLPGAARADLLIEYGQAGPLSVPRQPARVLVFDLGVLDTLDALGVPVAGVPRWPMPTHLRRYEGAAYAKIGTLFEPDEAAVKAAAPELILIGSRSRDAYARLAQLAPTLDLSSDGKDFYASVGRNAQTLGRIFAKEAEVAARLARLQASMHELAQRAPGAGRGLILLTTGGKIKAYGAGSRFGALHDVFGMPAALPGLPASGLELAPAAIRQADPDWIFVIDRDAAVGTPEQSAAQLLAQPLIQQTRAWQRQRLVYLDPVQLYLTSAGLRSEQALLDSLLLALRARADA